MEERDLRNVSDDDFKIFAKKYIRKYSKNVLKDNSDKNRKLVGYYVKGDIRVRFYDTVPSWVSRQQMYWIHGWKWENV